MVAAPIPITAVPPDQEVIPAWSGGIGPGYLVGAAQDLARWARALPVPGDDLQADFGLGVYAQMVCDPQIKAALHLRVAAALNQPIQFSIPVPRTDPAYPKAAKIAAFVREALRRLPVPLEATLGEMMLDALTHGHKVAEKVWTDVVIDPAVGPQLIYKDIKPKPLGSTQFVQDYYGTLLGLVPTQGWSVAPGTSYVYVNGMLAGQRVYDPAHFLIFSWDAHNRDPRGHSALRCVYGAWWQKRQTEPGSLAYLARFGQPTVDIEMAPGTPAQMPDSTGTLRDSNQVYLAMGEALQAGGVSVRPSGSKLTLVEAGGDGKAYGAFAHQWNSEISIGLTGQTLATNEAEFSGRAHATVHRDMLSTFTRWDKAWVVANTNLQLILPLVLANYGAAALPLAPHAHLGRIDVADLMAMSNAIAQLTGQGYWNPLAMPDDVGAELDARLDLPVRQMVHTGPTGQPAQPAQPSGQPQPQPVPEPPGASA